MPGVGSRTRGNRAFAGIVAAAGIGQENSFAGDFRRVIKDLVHRLKTEIRHANRIGVRIAERDAQLRATLQHPALFAGEFSFIAFDDLLHAEHSAADERGYTLIRSFKTLIGVNPRKSAAY